MLICGVDLETTGLTDKDRIIEIGAVLFDDTFTATDRIFSTFVKQSIPITPLIKELTGITDEQVANGVEPIQALNYLVEFSKNADIFCAHNKAFETGFIKQEADSCKFEYPKEFGAKQWICSKEDVKKFQTAKCRKLSHLAADYRVDLLKYTLHRSVNDVLLMGELLKAANVTGTEMLAYALEPWIYLEALTHPPWKDQGVSTGLAKADGYGWEKCVGSHLPVFPKMWVKRVKQSEIENEKAKQVGFQRTVINQKEV